VSVVVVVGPSDTTSTVRNGGRDRVPDVEFVCPRCSSTVEARYYGPCEPCRSSLRDAFRSEGRVVELAEYEPKMNVTPNAVALKDD
jgi:hypothetical protein